MFNSVLTTLKTQSEKLKETIHTNVDYLKNSESVQDLTFSRLKSNVIQKSAWIQSSVAQKLQPYLLNNNPSANNGSDNQVSEEIHETCMEIRSYNYDEKSPQHRSLSSYFRPKVHINVNESSSNEIYKPTTTAITKRSVQKNRSTNRRFQKPQRNANVNINKTWIDRDIRNNSGRKLLKPENDNSSTSSDDSDEDITDKFARVTASISASFDADNRRTDRDEIRRRLALESEDLNSDKPGRKPSLHSRLQSSMNLQICFMNETASDSESPGSDSEVKPTQQPASLPYVKTTTTGIGANAGAGVGINNGGIAGIRDRSSGPSSTKPSEDFFSRQARLQADARQALSQAKDLAKLQMSNDKERRVHSPITEMVRNSLLKVGVSLPPERRRVSRQLLTEMNVAQLQVIVNDLHTHIEVLNETLVSMLLDRDDLHMEQDSMLVDIEDLTRYLAAKDSSNSPHQSLPLIASSKLLLGRK